MTFWSFAAAFVLVAIAHVLGVVVTRRSVRQQLPVAFSTLALKITEIVRVKLETAAVPVDTSDGGIVRVVSVEAMEGLLDEIEKHAKESKGPEDWLE